jgi:hypothetical protein
MARSGIFYGNLKYIRAIRYVLWPFGNLAAIWYVFPRFGTLCHEKSGNPAPCVFSPSCIDTTFRDFAKTFTT